MDVLKKIFRTKTRQMLGQDGRDESDPEARPLYYNFGISTTTSNSGICRFGMSLLMQA